jgi:hypothetical protein
MIAIDCRNNQMKNFTMFDECTIFFIYAIGRNFSKGDVHVGKMSSHDD